MPNWLSTDWIEPESAGGRSGEVRKLETLIEASQALATSDFRSALRRLLELLHRHHGAVRSSVVFVNEHSGIVELEVRHGLHPVPRRQRRVEGITAQVLLTGRPLVIPRVRRDQRWGAPRDASTDELTCVSVPILLDGAPVGALDIELPYSAQRDCFLSTRFMGALASVIGHTATTRRLVEAEQLRLVDENTTLRKALYDRGSVSQLIGASGGMRHVHTQVAQVAATNTTVLIRGESGTGKELIAEAIHERSPRAKKPLIKVNCAALPLDLLESELFGYAKGAFTGAHTARKGRFALADGGTLFLDEIGDLDLATQVKLLRVLQTREFEPIGSNETMHVDIRLIAASNRDLEKAIATRAFREDLYHRLNVFTIFVPPLRQRKPDVLLLADEFLARFSREHGREIRRISTPAIDMLMSYHWPGNVRELANAIERAVVICDGPVIHSHHLPPTLQTAQSSGTMVNLSLQEMVEAVEKDALQDALKTANGDRATAARLLRTTRRIFNYKVDKYGIDWRRFRA